MSMTIRFVSDPSVVTGAYMRIRTDRCITDKRRPAGATKPDP